MDDVLVIGQAGAQHFGQRLARGGVQRHQFSPGGIGNPIAGTGSGVHRLNVKSLQNFRNRMSGSPHASILASGERRVSLSCIGSAKSPCEYPTATLTPIASVAGSEVRLV